MVILQYEALRVFAHLESKVAVEAMPSSDSLSKFI